MTAMQNPIYLSKPPIRIFPHNWKMIGISLNGRDVWQCQDCKEWTVSNQKPDTHAAYIDPETGQHYGGQSITNCISDWKLAQLEKADRLSYNTHRE